MTDSSTTASPMLDPIVGDVGLDASYAAVYRTSLSHWNS